jgi:HAD superfamily hydrolase (TIGR01509 family)
MARIRAVLFDIDGTLLDSNDAHAHAWLDALRGHGKNVPFDLLRSKIGMGGDKLLPEIAGIDPRSIEGQSIDERRASILRAHYLADVGPFHGSRVLVDRLRSRGLIAAVVTSASKTDVAELLRAAAVADLIEVVVSGDDADASKPDPDLVEVVLERVGVEPNEAILVGDTPHDVEAGRRAGVAVVALRCGGGWTDRQLAGAVAIFDDPADLSARLDSSPFALDRDSDPPSIIVRPRRTAARGF